jgi:hypothetical protein
MLDQFDWDVRGVEDELFALSSSFQVGEYGLERSASPVEVDVPISRVSLPELSSLFFGGAPGHAA